MRKLVITALTTAALITIAGATSADAVDPSHLAAPTAGVHTLSVHVSHDGRPLRPGHTPLFMP
jgi:hypothetical protein